MSTTLPSPVKFIPLGAIIQEFWIGERNIVLGFPYQKNYQELQHPYFGETIGRIPNRLSEGKVCNLNHRDYTFVQNEGGITTLHGGLEGWGKKIWNGPQKVIRNAQKTLLFTLRSLDGDEGFPGEVEARVWYGVRHKRRGKDGDCRGVEQVVLDIEYEIEMTGEEADITETVCAMTNHGYWNLSDGPTVAGTEIKFATEMYLEVDEFQIPTGRMLSYPAVKKEETVFFTVNSPVIDDCFVLDMDALEIPIDTRGRSLRKYISMSHEGTGLHLEAFTTEPSFQFYTGDGIETEAVEAGEAGEAGIDGTRSTPTRGPRSGIAIEPNRYVNAVNMPEWRSLVLLKRGEVWGCRNRFSVWQESDVAKNSVRGAER